MRALWAFVVLSSCTCFDSAYDRYCLSHPCAQPVGGGTATGGGGGGEPVDSGAGGGGVEDAGSAGGGSAPMDALALLVASPFKATTCQRGSVALNDGTTHLPAPAAQDVDVALDGGAFFGDAMCSAQIDKVTLPANASQVPFYLRLDGFGAATLSAQAPGLSGAQLGVTSTALARLIVVGDVVPMGAGCPVQMTLRIVDEDSKAVPVPALADSLVHVVPTGQFIGFGTQTCGFTGAFDVTVPAGQSAITLYAGAFAGAPCGSFATLTMSSMKLAEGLSLDGAASEASLYYLKYPPTVVCADDPQCCNGTCSMQQCN